MNSHGDAQAPPIPHRPIGTVRDFCICIFRNYCCPANATNHLNCSMLPYSKPLPRELPGRHLTKTFPNSNITEHTAKMAKAGTDGTDFPDKPVPHSPQARQHHPYRPQSRRQKAKTSHRMQTPYFKKKKKRAQEFKKETKNYASIRQNRKFVTRRLYLAHTALAFGGYHIIRRWQVYDDFETTTVKTHNINIIISGKDTLFFT